MTERPKRAKVKSRELAVSIDSAIREISEELEIREEFERRRAIRMGLDPKKVLSDRQKPVQQYESSRVRRGSG